VRRTTDKYHLMECFCCVVEQKSFAKAAQRLGIPSSSISKNIRQLESSLEQTLLIRTTRSMSLTDSGEAYYIKGKELLGAWNELDKEIVDLSNTPNGLLRISLPKTIGHYLFSPLINDFMIRYPKIKVELHFSHKPVSLLEDQYDIAIRTWKNLPNSNLYKVDLMELQPILIASPDYIKNYGLPSNIEELSSHKLLSFQRADKRVNKWLITDKEVLIDSHYSSNDYMNLLQACKKGLGIANMYSIFAKDAINCGELVPILPNVEQKKSHLSALYKQSRVTSNKLNCFFEFLEEHFKINSI